MLSSMLSFRAWKQVCSAAWTLHSSTTSFNHVGPYLNREAMPSSIADEVFEEMASVEPWDLRCRLQNNHEERLLCATNIYFLPLAIGLESSILTPVLLPIYRFQMRRFSATQTDYFTFLDRHIHPQGFTLSSGWESMRLLNAATPSTKVIKGVPQQSMLTRKCLAKVALWKGGYLQSKWNHVVKSPIGELDRSG
jgi:hypothetical protein